MLPPTLQHSTVVSEIFSWDQVHCALAEMRHKRTWWPRSTLHSGAKLHDPCNCAAAVTSATILYACTSAHHVDREEGVGQPVVLQHRQSYRPGLSMRLPGTLSLSEPRPADLNHANTPVLGQVSARQYLSDQQHKTLMVVDLSNFCGTHSSMVGWRNAFRQGNRSCPPTPVLLSQCAAKQA